jgi:hypothetical protein
MGSLQVGCTPSQCIALRHAAEPAGMPFLRSRLLPSWTGRLACEDVHLPYGVVLAWP